MAPPINNNEIFCREISGKMLTFVKTNAKGLNETKSIQKTLIKNLPNILNTVYVKELLEDAKVEAAQNYVADLKYDMREIELKLIAAEETAKRKADEIAQIKRLRTQTQGIRSQDLFDDTPDSVSTQISMDLPIGSGEGNTSGQSTATSGEGNTSGQNTAVTDDPNISKKNDNIGI